MIIPGMFMISRVMANVEPSDVSSNKNMGIFVVDHAPIKMRFFFITRIFNNIFIYKDV